MKQAEVERFILELSGGKADTTSEPGLNLFKNQNGKIFAVIQEGSDPLRIDAKCDVRLAKHLREKYETVLPSKTMEAATWNEIICAGQLTDEEVCDLLRLSYEIVGAS
ncbi:MAG: MmcQ/YjbR family DNA-binding protein [Candidatus Nomurabacteria bacterium]|jgi:predicted DNA-binding protein (MmcQ/YjbR family)|nr:MmcQ/YjbR family DNA-binding protein [Candidatus Nomurabacteria bacterium]